MANMFFGNNRRNGSSLGNTSGTSLGLYQQYVRDIEDEDKKKNAWQKYKENHNIGGDNNFRNDVANSNVAQLDAERQNRIDMLPELEARKSGEIAPDYVKEAQNKLNKLSDEQASLLNQYVADYKGDDYKNSALKDTKNPTYTSSMLKDAKIDERAVKNDVADKLKETGLSIDDIQELANAKKSVDKFNKEQESGTGKYLNADQELLYNQASIEALNKDERNAVNMMRKGISKINSDADKYGGHGLQADARALIMKDDSYGTGYDMVKQGEDELKSIGWDDKQIEEYKLRAERLANADWAASQQAPIQVNEDDSKVEKYAKAGANWALQVGMSIPAQGSYLSNFMPAPEGQGRDMNSPLGKYRMQSELINEQSMNALSEDTFLDNNRLNNWIDEKTGFNPAQYIKENTGQNVAQFLYNATESAGESALMREIGLGVADSLGVANAAATYKMAVKEGVEISKELKKAATIETIIKDSTMLPFMISGYESAYKEARENGASEKGAQLRAYAGGMAEYITEKLPMEDAWEIARGTKAGKNLIVNMLVNAGIEGLEEIGADALNDMADAVISSALKDKKSDINQRIDELVANGMTREQAESQILKEKVGEYLTDGIAGFIAGVGSSGAATVEGYKYANYNRSRADYVSKNSENLANYNGDSEYAKSVREMGEKYKNNPTQYLVDNIDDSTVTGKEAKEKLQKYADKEASGKTLSKSERFDIEQIINEAERASNVARKDSQSKYEQYVKDIYAVPDEYKTTKSTITVDEARKQMSEAASNGDATKMGQIYAQMKNSSSAEARNRADGMLDEFSGMAESNGASAEDIRSASVLPQDAYLSGLRGEAKDSMGSLTTVSEEAYNAGTKERIQTGSFSIQNKSDLTTKVSTGSGTINVKSISGNNLVTDKGEVSIDSVNNATIRSFYSAAASLKNDIAENAYLNSYKEGINLKTYDRVFNEFYTAGKSGASLESVMNGESAKVKAEYIGADNIKAIYEAGAAVKAVDSLKKNISKNLNYRGKGKVTYAEGVEQSLFAEAIASVSGINVEVKKELEKGVRAEYSGSEGRITLKESDLASAFHELTHFGQDYAEEEYKKLKQTVIDTLMSQSDKFAREWQIYEDTYSGATLDEVSDEFVASAMVGFMSTEEGQKAFAKSINKNFNEEEKISIVDKVKSFFDRFIKAVKDMVSSSTMSAYEKKVMNAKINNLQDIVDQWVNMFEKASEVHKTKDVEVEKTEVDNEDFENVNYSLELDEDRVFYANRVEVVKNPTSKEYQQMREDILKARPWLRDYPDEPLLRHTYDENGNEYYWEAMGGLHSQIEPQINKRYNTRTSQQWEWWTKDNKDDYPVDWNARYSLNTLGNELSEGQQEFFKDSQVRDENGRLKIVYHGTRRADRVGTVFDPNRATSGPMAFFTDDKEIATNYSKAKADTSLSRDPKYDSYYTQFRINVNGNDMSVSEAWNKLPTAKRTEIMRKAKHVTMDDDYENIIYDENKNNGLGNFDQYLLKEHKNNYLEALTDAWLESGDLFGEESRFIEVLNLVGLDGVEYMDPEYREEKVYDTYLNITNPLKTQNLKMSFVKEFEEWLKNVDQSKYETDDYASDGWDKTSMNIYTWIGTLMDDIRNNTTYSWTTIPDQVTDFLKEKGYDGIEDKGGKFSNISHTVYIPFYSEQIKNTDNLNPTTNPDIRYSMDMDIDDLIDDLEYEELDDSWIPSINKIMNDIKTDSKNLKIDAMGDEFIENGKAIAFTDERIEKYLKMYAASNEKYAQAYVTYLSPKEFLYLTANGKNGERLDTIRKSSNEFNESEFVDAINYQPIFLNLDEENNEIIGHEGRHRMYALAKAGVSKVPVLIFNYDNKYSKERISTINVYPQAYTESDKYTYADQITLNDIEPLSRGNKETIVEKFGSGAKADIMYSIETDANGKKYVDIQEDLISNITDDNQIKDYVWSYIEEAFESVDMFGFNLPITSVGRDEFIRSKYTNLILNHYHDIFIDKMRMANNLNEIVDSADSYKYENPRHPRKDDIIGFVRGKVNIRVGSKDYVADVVLADRKNAGIMFYDIVTIKPTTIKAVTKPIPQNNEVGRKVTASNQNVTQNNENSNSKKSLMTDSTGRELSEGQREFFKNAKTVDDNGNLKVYYHGARGAGFTVFDPAYSDDGISLFFSDSLEVAKGYSGTHEIFYPDKPMTFKELNQNMKDFTYGEMYAKNDGEDVVIYEIGMDEDNEVFRGTLMEAQNYFIDSISDVSNEISVNYASYLNIVNPLIVDGNGADWNNLPALKGVETDEDGNYTTRGYAAYAKANGYDGVIFNDLYDIGLYSSVREAQPSQVVVAFNSNQIKSIYNLNPTTNDDIRFSRETDILMEIFGETEEESTEVASILDEGLKALKNQQVDSKVVKNVAANIKQTYGSTISTNELSGMIEKAFAYLQSNNNIDYQDALRIFREIATPVIDKATTDAGSEVYTSFVNAMKGYSIKLNPTQMAEVKNAYGSYTAFKKAMLPLNFNSKTGTNLDAVWSEMVEQSGYILDPDTNVGDMPLALYDALAAMKPTPVNTFGGDAEEVAKDCALDIIREYFNAQGDAKAKAAADRVKATQNEYRKKVRDSYNARLKTVREKTTQAIKEARYNERWKAAENNQRMSEELLRIKAKNKNAMVEARKRQNVKHEKAMISKEANKLVKWVVKPSDEHHVPKRLEDAVLQLFNALDFVEPEVVKDAKGYHITNYKIWDEDVAGHKKFKVYTGATVNDVLTEYAADNMPTTNSLMDWNRKMSDIRDILKSSASAVNNNDYSQDSDMHNFMQLIDPDLAEEFIDMLDRNDGKVAINNADLEDLKTIKKTLRGITHWINYENKTFASNNSLEELATDTFNTQQRNRQKDHTAVYNRIAKNLKVDMATPETAFELMGGKVKSLFDAFNKAFEIKTSDIKQSSEYMAQVLKDVKDIKKWSGKKAEMHVFNLSGGRIDLTTAHIMSLYELSKRPQALQHILIGGIETDNVLQKKKLFNVEHAQNQQVHITYQELQTVIDTLTDQQKDIADRMQWFLANECAKWGNEASMKMYDYEKFGEAEYFPIKTDADTHATNNQNAFGNLLNGIEHMGMTKALQPKADNAIVVTDIFDVFSQHVTQMAAYHSYAPAVKDTIRWMNYKTRTETDGLQYTSSVKKAINSNFGRVDNAGVQYFEQFLKDINEQEKNVDVTTFWSNLIGNYKGAAVGANLRVVVQQPTAYTRAANMINAKYLMKALPKIFTASSEMKRITEISPTAYWKSQGYYETNMGKSLKEIITGIDTPRDRVIEKSMWLAGKADDITWACLYNAVEMEQKAQTKGQNLTQEEFTEKVNERFRDVIAQTQVVDATIQKSQWMRNKGVYSKMLTSFMAEPTKSYNMAMKSMIQDYRENGGNFLKWKSTWKALIVLGVTDLLNSLAQALMDAVRYSEDKDDYWDTLMEYFLSDLMDNVNPINRIPGLKDVWELLISSIKGEGSYGQSSGQLLDASAIESAMDMVTTSSQLMQGTYKKTGFAAGMTYAKGISNLTGIPLYNLSRDLTSFWNLFADDGMKLKKKVEKKTDKYNKVYDVLSEEESDAKLEEAIQKALEGGGTVEDIKSTLSSKYKSQYMDAFAEDDTETMNDIRNILLRGYTKAGYTEADLNDTISGWTEEKVAYSLVDDAIESGEGIKEAVKALQDAGKEDDAIIKHIVEGYEHSIEYERAEGLDTSFEDNVNTALSSLNTNYDKAKKDLLEKAQKAAEKKAATEKKNAARDKTYEIIEKGTGDYKSAINEWMNAGAESSSIKSDLTSDYVKPYVKAYMQGDSNAQAILIRIATSKAYMDEATGFDLPKKYNGDYFQYEMDQIYKMMEKYQEEPW